MLNFKISRPTDKFFEVFPEYDYKFKGKTYKMTSEFLRRAPVELQQSFGAFVAKKFPPQPNKVTVVTKTKVKQSETTEEPTIGSTYLPQKVEGKKTDRQKDLIIRELKRLAKSETVVEEKLNYPKVFRALLTEPHTALEQKRKTVEEACNLTLILDTNNRYWSRSNMSPEVDCNLIANIIEAAKGIKGITVFATSGLHHLKYKNKHYDYYTDLYQDLPLHLRKNVIVFTQGCGGVGNYNAFRPKLVKFVTPFEHGKNCGCGQIAKAEAAQQIMFYGIDCATKLSKIK